MFCSLLILDQWSDYREASQLISRENQLAESNLKVAKKQCTFFANVGDRVY